MKLLILAAFWALVEAQSVFLVEEAAPVGTFVGQIDAPGPYLIVPLSDQDANPEDDFIVNQNNGEIRTKRVLDREAKDKYLFSAIPLNGDSIQVTIEVQDINDNAPSFPQAQFDIDIPENIPSGTLRKLPAAVDRDQDGVQRYEIVQGNAENVFSLKYDKEALDLVVNGVLDREKLDHYEMVIVAYDGGKPPKSASMTLTVNVQDLNDSPPLFSKQRYFTTISENSPVGASVLKVFASDADIGPNAKITYSINRRQSDKDGLFSIDPVNGLLTVNKILNYERQAVHEIVVVAKDGGEVAQETSAFITVRLTASDSFKAPSAIAKSNALPKLKLEYLNGNQVSEFVVVGQPFAHLVAINGFSLDPNDKLTLVQGENTFLIKGRQIAARRKLDYEARPRYDITVQVTKNNGDVIEETLSIDITDGNEHEPQFEKQTYKISLSESVSIGSSILQVKANDEDQGLSGRISYSLRYSDTSSSSFSDWFGIDEETGVITTQSKLDCELESNPSVIIVASDHGQPVKTATATFSASISDVNDHRPIFSQTFYDLSLSEDTPKGQCFLTLTATDDDCGENAIVSYDFREHSDYFQVGQGSGEVCLMKTLDYEKQKTHSLLVEAKDSGGLSTSTLINVAVIDVNDNVPEFQPSVYMAKITRDTPLNRPILTVKASDKDYDLKGKLKYEIVSGNEEGHFVLVSDSGEIYLSKRPQGNSYRLRIRAKDGEDQVSSNEANAIIQVVQNIPFAKYQFEFNVPEDISPYSEIGSINHGQGSQFKYDLLEQSVTGYFSLDAKSGTIRSEARLDHESHPYVILNIQAEDESNGQIYFVQAIIKVSDVNDNAPEFPYQRMSTTVPEDFPASGVFYTSLATDADGGLNGKIKYRIMDGPDKYKFRIDPQTGEIRLVSNLDYEAKDFHQITVEAEDSGVPVLRSTMKLDIHVQDVNDNAPIFDKAEYNVALSEAHLPGIPLLTIHAEDKDSHKNGRVTYSMTSNPFLEILPNSGVVILKSAVQKEINPTLSLTVVATDNGLPSRKSSVPVKIIVSDKNDFTPKFQRPKYSFNTLENLPSGTVIGSVTADDNDDGLNGQVEYRFRAPNSKFLIESSSGEIKTLERLDREELDQYELLVEAMDQGMPRRSSQALVKITVDDVNDEAPMLEVPQNRMIYVPKTSSSLSIGNIVATDKDKNEVLTYDIVNNGGDIIIDKWTGELKLTSRAVAENGINSTVTVKISDSARPEPNSIEEDIAIFFVDDAANELLSLIQYDIKVDKESKPGTLIGNLNTLVSNRNRETFIYRFLDSDLPFFINSDDGDVFLIKDLNATRQMIYKTDVVIEPKSGSSAPLTARINFHVADVHHQGRPRFSEDPLRIQVPENTRLGQSIHQMMLENDNVIYAMLDQAPNEAFSIEPNSGKIKLIEQLDYERDKNFVLTVRVTESKSQLSTFVTVLVTVIDVNDNQPLILSGDSIKLTSEVNPSIPFTKIVAVDKDHGDNGRLVFSILSGNDDNTFKINAQNGDLFLVRPTIKDHYLRVRVKDSGTPSLFSDQELHIMAASGNNFGQPKFLQNPMDVSVQENALVGTTISTLKTLNNQGYNLNYELLVGDDKFKLDPSSGQLRTQAVLDREEQGSYSLVVSVSDQRFPQFSDTAIVNVHVEDLNDNDPVFGPSCRDINVPENFENDYLHTFIAHDPDEGLNGQLRYKLVTPNSPFLIDPNDGRISAPPLDRERKSSYGLEVIAEDQGSVQSRSASCLITVNVLDENDNSPSFTQSIYSASVKENVPKGTEVLTVLATDLDQGDNAKVEYSLENVTDSAFSIDKEKGTIYTTDFLDRETMDKYSFNVLAVDNGKGTIKSSRAVVNIIITDANDHTPQFDEFPFKVNITATPNVGQPLLRLSASDPDLGAHSQLTYNLIRPEQRELFELSASDGILTVINSDITWEPGTVQRLEVSVSDAGRPPRSSTGLVEVSIEGGPAITLAFKQETYHAELTENPLSGEDVVRVHAVRSDGRRQSVIYTFLRGNEDEAFEINSNNGLIRVRDPEVIDYEKHKQFELVIQGQGLGVENDLTAFTKCIISVKNINDNKPKFVQNVYNARVIEGLKKNTKVTVVTAFDLDYDHSMGITYEIVGGNVDDAFYMTTSQPGVILTNAVLDREVRDTYELTIAAKDNGKPSLSGECKVKIDILDVNDSPLQFPNFPKFKINKNLSPGSLITTIRANDIDLISQVAYTIEESPFVAISTFTGQVYLRKPIEEWNENEIKVRVAAFDGKFKAEQDIAIYFEEIGKDCLPKFSRPLYRFSLSLNASFPTNVGDLEAKSCNGEDSLNFDLINAPSFASIINSNGSVIINQPMPTNSSKLVAQAQDKRTRQSTSAVIVINTRSKIEQPLEFDLNTDTLEVGNEDEVFQLKLKNQPDDQVVFNITTNPFVVIDPLSGKLFKKSGHPEVLSGNVEISARKIGESPFDAIKKSVRFFMPSNQLSSGQLKVQEKEAKLSLNSNILTTRIGICDALTSALNLQILSGNDDNLYSLDSNKQVLTLVKKPLGKTKSRLIIRMGDLNICIMNIDFIEDNEEQASQFKLFPMQEFVSSIAENSPRGTLVMTLPTLIKDNWTFSSSSKVFNIHPRTGSITTNKYLDYEEQTEHELEVIAQKGSSKATCSVKILILSQDEYPPIFSQDVFTFTVPPNVAPGFFLGKVRATDADKGSDGFITYSISPLNTYFDIDHKTGAITVRRQLDTGVIQNNFKGQRLRHRRSLTEVQFNVVAKSFKTDSLTSTTKVILYVNEEALPIAASTEDTSKASVVVGVLVGVILVLIFLAFGVLWCWRRTKLEAKQANKIAMLPSPPGTIGNASFTPDQSLEMVGSRYPPQYSEIMSDYERTTTTSAGNSKAVPRSELSEKSHRSTSSGRGSVEDGDEDAEDSEIQMINANTWDIPRSSLASATNQYEGDDHISQTSVQNTEEYLARLGIDIRKPPNVKLPNSGSEDPYSTGGQGSIYNRIADDAMSEHNSTISATKPHSLLYGSTGRQLSMTGSLSSIVHSEEELAGSYNWDYLLDWCPQYQNLAHVFKEISKLKDDDNAGDLPGVPPTASRFPNFVVKNNQLANRLVPVRARQSPIVAQDMLSQNALSPSFHPSLSPLATKSPSVSPMSVPLKRDLGPPRIGRGPLQ